MFAGSGHFRKHPCPYIPNCPRNEYCVFSHVLPPSRPRKIQKISPPVAQNPKPKIAKASTETSLAKQIPGSDIAKRPKPNSSLATVASKPDNKPTREKPSVILVSNIDVRNVAVKEPSKHSPILPEIHLTSGSGKRTAHASETPQTTGPPVLPMDPRSHTNRTMRQSTMTKFYEQFQRIYAPIQSTHPGLPSEHALRQEAAVHSKSNKGSYRNVAVNVLMRLKKRPEATSSEDVGIDGEWEPPKESVPVKYEDALQYILSEEQLESMGYPVRIPVAAPDLQTEEEENKKQCERCKATFTIKETLEPADMSACTYHFGRLRVKMSNGEKLRIYTCCNETHGHTGCVRGPHVFKDDDLGVLHKKIPFVETPEKSGESNDYRDIVALDCEMCYTTGGFELTRLTVIDAQLKSVLDELVIPYHSIIDLNTRFSGIHDLSTAKYDFEQIRSRLFRYLHKDTIVVGQSLENDFKVMRIIHNKVVDTAALFPHPNGLPYRYSLKHLSAKYMKVFIQDSEDGHDSYEDSKACMDLLALKIQKGPKFGVAGNE
ncbi:ribonuclease H-like protein [Basidiobolus meristosporus CBS 931.73]|uniref:Ribonuclease H-like protein n=1 Tax=Basidiobolus meristosporus CBS 931.73 TaxID=1314790 RepID=A0A1Y1Z010_9FUNG|nr:ribonuclease H-like protein [Basidiobolus meristosporus CBS 931.73]|eukprot:ORY03621.1 ribonuclease H-like protein [Basidiobolus meristosporus CBS 931.73]